MDPQPGIVKRQALTLLLVAGNGCLLLSQPCVLLVRQEHPFLKCDDAPLLTHVQSTSQISLAAAFEAGRVGSRAEE